MVKTMSKNYRKWTPVKIAINSSNSAPDGYNEREVWFCSVGENVGFEEDGKGEKFIRPVLILKIYNQFFCHVVPLSTTEKRNRFYYAFDGGTGKISVALLTQSRAVSSSRLHRKIGKICKEDFVKIKTQIKELLDL
ncbi:MAG: type II toxin-antitoxin system PemK/MazF family toxin [Candidatus Nomurabacteria bacterium]|jgi:mRNA interferase MazF|nr:type II toxin-antitoxin system PemK/MazF family toxin [Candidatus Nomurabacteria bacterium]